MHEGCWGRTTVLVALMVDEELTVTGQRYW
jgi:hypothetical protein